MTAQIPERVVYKRRVFDLCGLKGEDPFDPSAHGLNPRPLHTACWRGFVCTFAVREKSLLLKDLEVGVGGWDPDDEGPSETPPISGVEAETSGEGGIAIYRAMNHPLDFTGRMLIGRGFIDELYVHMGFQAPYTYREVVELVFEKGRLTESRDLSDEMAEIRQGLDERAGRPQSDLAQWIKKRFSLDY